MIEYEITNVDYLEKDAILGHRLYFQWRKEPPLEEALRFISHEVQKHDFSVLVKPEDQLHAYVRNEHVLEAIKKYGVRNEPLHTVRTI